MASRLLASIQTKVRYLSGGIKILFDDLLALAATDKIFGKRHLKIGCLDDLRAFRDSAITAGFSFARSLLV